MRARPRALPLVLTTLLVALTGYLAYRGWSFYKLSLDARVEHPDFRSLRPTGLIGNGFGYVGAALIFANLLYLARRKQVFQLGSMRTWLDVHVFTGLFAAVLVAFHSAFQLRTSIARATAISLGVVVVTGIIGRVLHLVLGRVQGVRTPDAASAIDARVPGLGRQLRAAVDAYPPTLLPANASSLRCLVTFPRWRREARTRREAVQLIAHADPAVAGATGARARELRRLVSAVERAAVADVRAVTAAAILRSWRSLHRLFAILMLLAVGLHVGVAWYYGYWWIFG